MASRLAARDVSTVVSLPTGKALTVVAAADTFHQSPGNSNTVRSYAVSDGKTAERPAKARPLATVAEDEIGEADRWRPRRFCSTACRVGAHRASQSSARLRRGLEAWVRDARAAGLDQEDLRGRFAVVLADAAKEDVA